MIIILNKISFENYNLVHKISLTSAGGAALLVVKDIKHKIWNNLNLQLDDCKNVWTEIDTTKIRKR